MKVFLLGFVTQVQAITLLQVLQTYSQLSSLSAYVNSSSTSTTLLANANNFTFLAPSNAAIASYLTQNPNVLTQDLLAATLQYALLKGGYPSLSFSDRPIFVESYLSNASYTNVTGGQRMELMSASGQADMVSGNKSISTSATAVCISLPHLLLPLSPLKRR
jgi:hypothetical protein